VADSFAEIALIVTGSAGIAAECARLAAEAGAGVLVASDDEISASELAAAIGGDYWAGDLVSPTAASSILAQCLSKYGRVDALLNGMGISGRRLGDGPTHECTDEGWEMTLAHNLKTMFQMSRAVTGRMLDQAPRENGVRGAILNVGSVLSESPEPRHFALHAYAAAKGAVISMTRSMAAYYAPYKIRVNAISPGLVRTPASERSVVTPELAMFIDKKQPLTGGMVDSADVARTALFLLSDEARAITGEVVAVDGGWSVTGVG
jgi:NAD(P)-dependent dehydrogenase (short-subunit alcohol dehydrogenase family)